MNNVEERTLTLLEAIAEARTLVQELTCQGEELKAREVRLGDLLAPSEAALKARTEYLDRVMREHLERAEQRITTAAEEIGRLPDPYSRALAEASAKIPRPTPPPPLVVQLLALTLGGFLAGTAAIWWTTTWSAKTPPAASAPQPSAAPAKAPRPTVARH